MQPKRTLCVMNNTVNGSNATSGYFLPGVAPFVPGRSFCPPHMGYVPNILTNRSQFRPQFAANQTLFPPPGSLNQVLGATNLVPNMNSRTSVPVPRPAEINSEERNDLSSKEVRHKDNDKDSHHIYTTRTQPAGEPGVTENDRHISGHGPGQANQNKNDQTTLDDPKDVFVGVLRGKRKRYLKYYVSNIDERSTRKGIMSHFSENGVQIHELQLFRSRNDNCYAQIVIESKYKEAIESDDFSWPDNVFCAYWKSNARAGRQDNIRRNDRRDYIKRNERRYRQ